MTERLAGGSPELWDSIHETNVRETDSGLYPLRSAPERALLAAALAECRLRPGDAVLELGCGGSRFLPHLAVRAGVRVAGVDFSPAGVEHTRAALERVRVDSEGIELDRIETYVPRAAGTFDAVVSFNLVEHFDDLDWIVRSHLECVKPGGRIFLSAPNLTHVNRAWIQRVAPSLLTWHQTLEADTVAEACRAAGGSDISVRYLGGVRLFAYPDPGSRVPTTVGRAVRKTVNGAGELAYRLTPSLSTKLAGARLSPYFAVGATRAR